jgi:hypothetical protein
MPRLRGSLLFVLLFACAHKSDPEPLASYGSEHLRVIRGRDREGAPIVFAYLFPRSDDDCAPLAPVRARIDGRSLLVREGGDGPTCTGASFQAPVVVLSRDVDFHELDIADDSAQIRARVADLASDARLDAASQGDRVRVSFDHFVRGHVSEARATWSAVVTGETTIEDDAVIAVVPDAINVSGRVVLQMDLVVDLDVAECAGISKCDAKWLVHEVFDVSVSR